jgi:hypothetical protein
MDEGDLEPEESLARPRVDQIGAGVGELGKRRTEICDLVGDVVHARPALGEKAADRCVLVKGLEQLEASLADPERRRAYTLIVNGRLVLDVCAEESLVRCQRLVEIFDGDTDVVDPASVHPDADAICVRCK